MIETACMGASFLGYAKVPFPSHERAIAMIRNISGSGATEKFR